MLTTIWSHLTLHYQLQQGKTRNFKRVVKMMANDPGSAPPGSPRSPRLPRSRTNSPLMAGGRSFSPGIHADPTFMNLKDSVMGELASRIKKPVSSSAGFNKNRQGNSKSLTNT